jgi:hypothetical protein
MSSLVHGATQASPGGLTRSMAEEFRDNDGGAWRAHYAYVVHERAVEQHDEQRGATRDAGRAGMSLEDFAALGQATAAGLTLAEVAAIRLFTGCSSLTRQSPFNAALRAAAGQVDARNNAPGDGSTAAAQEWATTIAILTSAIFKLSAVSPRMEVYRGLRHGALAAAAVASGGGGGDSGGGGGGGGGDFSGYIDAGFGGFSSDAAEAARYGGAPSDPALFFVVDFTWSARGASVAAFSQFPTEAEWTMPPFTGFEIVEVEDIGAKTLLRVRPHVSFMRHYTDNLRFPHSSPNDPLTAAEHDELCASVQRHDCSAKMAAAAAAGAGTGNGDEKKAAAGAGTGTGAAAAATTTAAAVAACCQAKLASATEEDTKYAPHAHAYLTRQPKIAALGLEEYMGIGEEDAAALMRGGAAAIRGEFQQHGTAEDQEWLEYIWAQPASEKQVKGGVRDKGRDGTMVFRDFVASPAAREANLTEAHVLALRLYTSPAYPRLNEPLREFAAAAESGGGSACRIAKPHRFPATVLHLNEGIRRLRAVGAEQRGREREKTLWRGVKGVAVPEEFMLGGGVEVGVMSATFWLDTAVMFARGSGGAGEPGEEPGESLIFKYVTSSFMERGADVAFLSVFPMEQECVFPPLTFLLPTGRRQRVGKLTIVEVAPRL